MNCKEIRALTDAYLDEQKKELTIEMESHINSCEACSNYYNTQLEALEILATLNTSEPSFSDPASLTENIMAAIAKDQKHVSQDYKKANIRSAVLKWGHRLLAAASLCLLLTFGFEQYVVVDKITNLEHQLSKISDAAPMIVLNKAQFVAFPNLNYDNLSDKPLIRLLMKERPLPSGQSPAEKIHIKSEANDH